MEKIKNNLFREPRRTWDNKIVVVVGLVILMFWLMMSLLFNEVGWLNPNVLLAAFLILTGAAELLSASRASLAALLRLTGIVLCVVYLVWLTARVIPG